MPGTRRTHEEAGLPTLDLGSFRFADSNTVTPSPDPSYESLFELTGSDEDEGVSMGDEDETPKPRVEKRRAEPPAQVLPQVVAVPPARVVLPRKRHRRRKCDPEPDYSAISRARVANSRDRSGQACDRCRGRKMTCDNHVHGCHNCLSAGKPCNTTNRITGQTTTRGAFERAQHEIERLKTEIAILRSENARLTANNNGLQYRLRQHGSVTPPDRSTGQVQGNPTVPNGTYVPNSLEQTPPRTATTNPGLMAPPPRPRRNQYIAPATVAVLPQVAFSDHSSQSSMTQYTNDQMAGYTTPTAPVAENQLFLPDFQPPRNVLDDYLQTLNTTDYSQVPAIPAPQDYMSSAELAINNIPEEQGLVLQQTVESFDALVASFDNTIQYQAAQLPELPQEYDPMRGFVTRRGSSASQITVVAAPQVVARSNASSSRRTLTPPESGHSLRFPVDLSDETLPLDAVRGVGPNTDDLFEEEI